MAHLLYYIALHLDNSRLLLNLYMRQNILSPTTLYPGTPRISMPIRERESCLTSTRTRTEKVRTRPYPIHSLFPSSSPTGCELQATSPGFTTTLKVGQLRVFAHEPVTCSVEAFGSFQVSYVFTACSFAILTRGRKDVALTLCQPWRIQIQH